MAGGEFCGNASLCTAALLLLDGDAPVGAEASGPLRVSGVRAPVEVRIRREAAERFRGGLRMPPALSVGETELRLGGVRAPVPLVRMEGISHLILRPDCAFFPILRDRGAAIRSESPGTRGPQPLSPFTKIFRKLLTAAASVWYYLLAEWDEARV